jgi:methyl-accepting chemotaxis protein
MFKGIRSRLILLVICIAIVPLVIIFLIFSQELITTLLGQREKKIQEVTDLVESTFIDLENQTITYSRLLANLSDIKHAANIAITTNEYSELKDLIEKYHGEIGLDVLEVVDKDGTTIVSAHRAENVGENIIDQKIVRAALKGGISFGLEKENMQGYGIKAAAPIIIPEGVIGVIVVGELLDDNFARLISESTLVEAALFYKGELIGISFASKLEDEERKINIQEITAQLHNIVATNSTATIMIGREPFYCSMFSRYIEGEREFPSPLNPFEEEDSPIQIVIGISTKSIVAAQQRMITALIVILIIVGGGAVLAGGLFSYRLTKPLGVIKDFSQSLAARAGDLTQRIEIKSHDELGSLATSFNKMVDSLHDIVLRIKDTSNNVYILTQEFSTSTEEINATAQEVTSTIQEITQRVGTQAHKTDETTSTMKRMGESVQLVATNAREGAKVSQETAELAQQGMESSHAAEEISDSIIRVVEEIASVVKQLGERSQEINRIVDVITNIADQTNLLALNAAIEAARAGEAGRGFAVVSDEVRKLAESSAQSAEQIGGLVKAIQTKISKAVQFVDATSHEVEKGRETIKKVHLDLEKIMNAAQLTARQVEEIVAASGDQMASTDEVNISIREVATLAQGNATSAEQIYSSVEGMTAGMEEITSGAQKLVGIAQNLQELIGKFRVKD